MLEPGASIISVRFPGFSLDLVFWCPGPVQSSNSLGNTLENTSEKPALPSLLLLAREFSPSICTRQRGEMLPQAHPPAHFPPCPGIHQGLQEQAHRGGDTHCPVVAEGRCDPLWGYPRTRHISSGRTKFRRCCEGRQQFPSLGSRCRCGCPPRLLLAQPFNAFRGFLSSTVKTVSQPLCAAGVGAEPEDLGHWRDLYTVNLPSYGFPTGRAGRWLGSIRCGHGLSTLFNITSMGSTERALRQEVS